MFIYDNPIPPESQPVWLYVKQHKDTGLKYFGKTTAKDPYKYKGSGKYWSAHLKKHGNHVVTLWTKAFYNTNELIDFATNFSIENDIVKSPDWANLVFENGIDGTTPGAKFGPMTSDHRLKISASLTGQTRTEQFKKECRDRMIGNQIRKGHTHSAASKRRMSESHIGKTASMETRRKMSDSKKGNINSLGHKHTEETKEKMSRSAPKFKTDTHKNNISKGKRGKQQKVVTCPYCGKSGGVSNLTRYHFTNCKMAMTEIQ